MTTTPYSRFPDLGKLTLALIENAVAPVLGKDAIQVIKGPYSNYQLYEKLCEILAEAEGRFYKQCPDKNIASGLTQLKLSDLESIKKYFWEFVQNPARSDFPNAVYAQFCIDYPTLPDKNRRDAVDLYVRILQDEIIVLDSDVREKLSVVALKNIANGVSQLVRNTERIVDQLDDISKLISPEKTIRDVGNSRHTTIPLTLSPLPRIRGFFGREEELIKIEDGFLRSPIVLIEGLAGIGKSSLAIKYIRENVKELMDVFWIECQDETTLEDILMAFSDYGRRNSDQEIAQAVDAERPVNDQLHSLIKVLEDRSGIICLDSFERTNEKSMGIFLQEILQHAQNMRVLICTRERQKSLIGILSELVEVPLKGLQIDASVEFLRSEIQKALNQSKLDVRYEEIAQKTEGHPFAIKLFVPLVTVYGISAKKLLYDSVDYGQTLEQNWLSKIFERLSKEERELLERFSIYEEPVKHEGVGYIFPDDNWSTYLQKIQGKFLINVDQEYFYTHNLIREFCIGKLKTRNQIIETANRAAMYYLGDQNIEVYDPEQTQEQVDTKLRAHHYLFMAEEYFLAAKVVWNIESKLMEWSKYKLISGLIDTTLNTIENITLTDDQKAEWDEIMFKWLTYYKARLLNIGGEIEGSLNIYKQLLDVSSKTKLLYENKEANENLTDFQSLVLMSSKNLAAECVHMIAWCYLEKELIDDVMSIFENNADVFGRGGKKYERMLEKMGMVLINKGDLANAETIFKRLLEWRDAEKDKFGGSTALRELAVISLARSDVTNALAYANLSYGLAQDINESTLQGLALRVMGDIYLKSNDAQQSIKSYEEAIKTFIEIENKHEIQKTGETLARLFDENGDSDRAEKIRSELEKFKAES